MSVYYRRTTLELAPPGSRVRVVEIQHHSGQARRLMELGVVPGAVIRVVSNSAGPIVIEVGSARFAIGRGLARRIVVEVVEQ
jgi:ferrous iron transport protein A